MWFYPGNWFLRIFMAHEINVYSFIAKHGRYLLVYSGPMKSKLSFLIFHDPWNLWVHFSWPMESLLHQLFMAHATYIVPDISWQFHEPWNPLSTLHRKFMAWEIDHENDIFVFRALKNVREYWPYRDELNTQNGIVYRGTRIIIPASMRREMTARAHRSHLGIQYTTTSARDIMYWPRMTADLTEAVQRCDICQLTRPAITRTVNELPDSKPALANCR